MKAPTRPKRTRLRATKQRAKVFQIDKAARMQIETLMGYTFRDEKHLTIALTHKSAVPGEASARSNERYEFLGDRVLGLAVSDQLLQQYPKEREGLLAKRLNAMVNREACAQALIHLKLDQYVILGRSEELSQGLQKTSILANVCEALLGAVYIDGGWKAAHALALHFWKPVFANAMSNAADPKSRLQEWAQGRGMPIPVYELLTRSGPDHAPNFVVQIAIEGFAPIKGAGKTKQAAEREAAQAMLYIIEDM